MDETGVIHQDVELRPLSGREEEILTTGRKQDAAISTTAILCRCIQRIGSISPISQNVARALLVADRQYLLLKLREATFGERVQATILCPWQDCGKPMDIEFSLRDIPTTESEDKGPIYKMELSPEAAFIDDSGSYNRWVTFRLPNGGDQEVVSPLLSEDEEKASVMLLERCIQTMGCVRNPGYEQISKLSSLARMEIEAQMETVAPKVDLTMRTICPECDRDLTTPFDIQSFFFSELKISSDLLYREVHYLAYHYHWSEREIMDMPRGKRRKHIEILADEIEKLNNAIR